MINLAISGCQGRMGQRIISLAMNDNDFRIAALLEHPDHPQSGEIIHNLKIATDPEAIRGSDVLIEFTTPESTVRHLPACLKHQVKMVIGTTALTPDQINQIKSASARIPIVLSSNMSVGVNILFGLAKRTAQQTGTHYSVKIREAHHIHKKDKPSGTAKTLAESIKEGSGITVTDIESIREGEIVGDHDIIFDSPEDTITIRHHAKSRDIFVKGSLIAAKFVAQQPSGLFTMKDVLGLN
ncbi:MAG: 4-hydroxy-tetrahydrodipicolinate reductase [Candidatus Omnitrophota bacterium]